jgi:hypothetical protein
MNTNQTQMTEQKYYFDGIRTDINYHQVLAYIAPTAEDAWNTCAKLNPNFLVQTWGLAD